MFVRHYLENGYNATQAAISAGYSKETARQMGHDNLSKPYIAEEIDKIKRKTAEKVEITYEWKVEMLKLAIEGCARGEASKDGTLHPSGLVSAIAELNKMQGHYSPEKQITTNKTVMNLTDDADEFAKSLDTLEQDIEKHLKNC